MKVWTTPQGEKLTLTEFLTRWKEGIKKASLTMPKQEQVEKQIKFTWIMLIGFVAGILVSIYYAKTLWWVIIVLVGAIGNTTIQLIALYQQKKIFSGFGELMNFKNEK